MIYVPNTENEFKDNLYFLTKEGFSIKLQKLYFTREHKNYIKTIFETKATKINAFTWH